MLETFIYLHYCSISAFFSKHEFMNLMYVHIRHFVKAHFQYQEHSPVHFKTHEHDFQPASLNKILETRIFSASTSPVLSLCVMMNVCIKHKTKPKKILKFIALRTGTGTIFTYSYQFSITILISNFDPTITCEAPGSRNCSGSSCCCCFLINPLKAGKNSHFVKIQCSL